MISKIVLIKMQLPIIRDDQVPQLQRILGNVSVMIIKRVGMHDRC